MTRPDNAFSTIPDFAQPPRDLIQESRAARRVIPIHTPPDPEALLSALERAAAAQSLSEVRAIAKAALALAGER
ncbi:hypothetical protein [Methylobacterium soli]|uniref:Uncharacterized protein n=1 Tax=Methylobacterium soli TaxID=553447 RepID=A0A6L3SWJ4_9HYPH|nr:hypothetical protein [Methylobacterium soli]KAB1076526.1 hypothetical protein F6X53_22750 [Methylobacterium soli]GJE44835.1 hypothetical protein AEGHOMDF_4026 [Methylobacterium soli]